MGLKYRLPLAFALALIMAFSLGFVSSCLSQSTEKSEAQAEGASFHFHVWLRRIDWSERTFDTYIEVNINDFPYYLKDLDRCYVQNWCESSSFPMYDRAPINLSSSATGPPYWFEGNTTTNFHFAGPAQLYPFDRYMINITFVLPFIVREVNI